MVSWITACEYGRRLSRNKLKPLPRLRFGIFCAAANCEKRHFMESKAVENRPFFALCSKACGKSNPNIHCFVPRRLSGGPPRRQ
jgi:hypothetical protein